MLQSFKLLAGAALAAGLCASPVAAEVIFTVSDQTPAGDNGAAGGPGTRTLSSSLGDVSTGTLTPSAAIVAPITYTITGLDLTSVGGGASETIAFNITYSQSGGTGVQFNSFGNVSVTGGDDTQISVGETLTATLSLNAATTFTGSVSLGFIELIPGGLTATGGTPVETFDVIHAGGTFEGTSTSTPSRTAIFDPSPYVTLEPTFGAMNLQKLSVQIQAVPEPGSLALLGLGGLLIARRRRD